MNKFLFAIALLALMLCSEGLTIYTPEGLAAFALSIERGMTYLGETVYLANDLTFPMTFAPAP